VIDVNTELYVDPDGGTKKVVMRMSVDDALSLSTIFLNLPDMGLSDDWKKSISTLSIELLAAANRAR
jgi:hypothetical protein